MDRRKVIILFFIVLCTVALASAATTTTMTLPPTFASAIQDLESILLQIGSALAGLMIVLECIKWITAQNPAERESAKKGIIYILIGLFILKNSEKLIQFLLQTI